MHHELINIQVNLVRDRDAYKIDEARTECLIVVKFGSLLCLFLLSVFTDSSRMTTTRYATRRLLVVRSKTNKTRTKSPNTYTAKDDKHTQLAFRISFQNGVWFDVETFLFLLIILVGCDECW